MMFRVDAVQAFAFIVLMISCLATETGGLKLSLRPATSHLPVPYESTVPGEASLKFLKGAYQYDIDLADYEKNAVKNRLEQMLAAQNVLASPEYEAIAFKERNSSSVSYLLPIFVSTTYQRGDHEYTVTGLKFRFTRLLQYEPITEEEIIESSSELTSIKFTNLPDYYFLFNSSFEVPFKKLDQQQVELVKKGYIDKLIRSSMTQNVNESMVTLNTNIELLENSKFQILQNLGARARVQFVLVKNAFSTQSFKLEQLTQTEIKRAETRPSSSLVQEKGGSDIFDRLSGSLSFSILENSTLYITNHDEFIAKFYVKEEKGDRSTLSELSFNELIAKFEDSIYRMYSHENYETAFFKSTEGARKLEDVVKMRQYQYVYSSDSIRGKEQVRRLTAALREISEAHATLSTLKLSETQLKEFRNSFVKFYNNFLMVVKSYIVKIHSNSSFLLESEGKMHVIELLDEVKGLPPLQVSAEQQVKLKVVEPSGHLASRLFSFRRKQ